jgi:carbon-monoxide dehydrogenase large subunit
MAWIEDRRENFLAGSHSRDHHYRLRVAFDADAHLMALEADLTCNVGAYSCYPVTWGVEPLMAMAELPGPYRLAEYSVRARGVATNTCPMAPYRGVSRPAITVAMERLMDIAAGRFALDPVEIRRRNLIEKFPHASPTGIVYDEGSYVASLDRAVEAIDVAEFRKLQQEERKHRRYRGVGFSVFSERTGYGTPAFAARGMAVTPGYEQSEITMDPSGFVEVRIGASPHGQGLETSLSQLIADELGIEPNRIRVRHGDTDATPYGWGTFASRSMVISGGACKLAAEKLRSKLAAIAGAHLEADPRDIELAGGRAFVRGTDVGIEISTLARIAYHQSHTYDPELGPGLGAAATYDPVGTFSNACHAAIVDVDVETGGVRVERFVVVEDAGILINPMIVEGQIHGGVVQGIANALLEEIVYDRSGNIVTASFMDYLPPTLSEVPVIEIFHLETTTDRSVTGAKGVGEGGAIGAPAAVINAVADALRPFKVDVLEFPITPERIRALLRSSTLEAV